MASYVTATLTAQNTFTDWIKPKTQMLPGVNSSGWLDLMINGTWAGTITVQKRHFHGPNPSDLTTTDIYDVTDGAFTSNTTVPIFDLSTTCEYRAGFKTGEFTSGSAGVRLEQ